MALTWFDAHVDLAYLAVSGRDMLAPLDPSAGPHAPAACTLPSMREGNVRLALGTIFTEVSGSGPEGYAPGDFERAFVVGRAQLEAYLTWQERGAVALDLREALASISDLGEMRGGMGVAEVRPLSTSALLARLSKTDALRVGILIENADPIRAPDDLDYWVRRGVVAVGLSWSHSSRYAGGNTTQDGISDLGRALVKEMDRLKVVHDVSHLSDRSFAELLEVTNRTLIASHSNCRAILDPSGQNQRHLTDAQIAEVVKRGGVIGLNLFSRFLSPKSGEDGRATIEDCVRHVEHVCEIAERVSPLGRGRRHVGLGSDVDGGFSAARLPLGINRPADFARIGEGLNTRGWTDEDVAAFACGNWLRVLAK